MAKRLKIILVLAIGLALTFVFFRYTAAGASLLWSVSKQGAWLPPLVVIAALIDSINPCAFSILILTVAFLMSIGRVRSNILSIGGAYIAGIFVVYMLIGVGLLQVLHIFNTPHFMATIGAALLVMLGLINVVGELWPAFPIRLRIPQAAHHAMASLLEKGSLPLAFVLGGLVGLCEFPCTGGPYLTVIGLLHDTRTYASGLFYLVLYNGIFILPLVILLLATSDKSLLETVERWQARTRMPMRLWGGIAMVVLGLIIYLI